RRDRLQPEPVAGGTAKDQALVEHSDGVLQVPLGEVQEAEAAVGNDQCLPSTFERGEAERFLPVPPALGEGSERTQGPRRQRLSLEPYVCTGPARLPVCRLYAPPQQFSRPAEVADAKVCVAQAPGCSCLQGTLAKRGREFEGLLARCYRTVVVSRLPQYNGHIDQHPSQPGPVVERPGQGLGLAQQGKAPPNLSQ